MIYHVVPGPLHGFMNELNLNELNLIRVLYMLYMLARRLYLETNFIPLVRMLNKLQRKKICSYITDYTYVTNICEPKSIYLF